MPFLLSIFYHYCINLSSFFYLFFAVFWWVCVMPNLFRHLCCRCAGHCTVVEKIGDRVVCPPLTPAEARVNPALGAGTGK